MAVERARKTRAASRVFSRVVGFAFTSGECDPARRKRRQCQLRPHTDRLFQANNLKYFGTNNPPLFKRFALVKRILFVLSLFSLLGAPSSTLRVGFFNSMCSFYRLRYLRLKSLLLSLVSITGNNCCAYVGQSQLWWSWRGRRSHFPQNAEVSTCGLQDFLATPPLTK